MDIYIYMVIMLQNCILLRFSPGRKNATRGDGMSKGQLSFGVLVYQGIMHGSCNGHAAQYPCRF